MLQQMALVEPEGVASVLSTEEVFIKYRDMVYRLAFARTGSGGAADDVLQDVFLRYVRAKPTFFEEEHRKAWLIRTTINCSRSLKSSAWERRTVPLKDTLAVRMKEHSEVYYAVLQLPAESRTLIHLFYYEDYSVREIASLLHISEVAVKTRLHRARKKLRTLLEEDAE